MKQVTQMDFSGQKIFAGIDVHKKSWKVSIRSEHMELQTFSQKPSAMELVKHLRSNYPLADYHVVYEAGFCGSFYHTQLCNLGIQNIIINAADLPKTNKLKTNRTDFMAVVHWQST